MGTASEAQHDRPRVLIAGIGNALRGDDGFGLAALEALEKIPPSPRLTLELYETGIAGVALAQKLMDGYDAVVMLDALDRGAPPGEVFVLRPDYERIRRAGRSDGVDPHLANPEGVVRLAHALGVLPRDVWIVGCQAENTDELAQSLSHSVAEAIPVVVDRVQEILSNLERAAAESGAAVIAKIDEMLQVLYWLRGEGLSDEVSPNDLTRLVAFPEDEIVAHFERLCETGLVELTRASVEPRERRYRLTESGLAEGGRRFAEEFADFTKSAHGECGDAGCDCHASGDAADCHYA